MLLLQILEGKTGFVWENISVTLVQVKWKVNYGLDSYENQSQPMFQSTSSVSLGSFVTLFSEDFEVILNAMCFIFKALGDSLKLKAKKL